jgi:hypothetical protein
MTNLLGVDRGVCEKRKELWVESEAQVVDIKIRIVYEFYF